MDDLIKIKKLKGKQNKKKWRKNIDVSGLMDQMEKNHNEEMRAKYQKPIIVEDTTGDARLQLDPNRFKNRQRPQPKKTYDNSYERQDLLADAVEDPWAVEPSSIRRNPQKLNIPAIIKPSTGHSYNPKPEHVDQIIDEVIDYEKKQPRKEKKIKKIVTKKIVPRARNKKVRQEYLQAVERKKQRAAEAQLFSTKQIKRQLEEKQRKIKEKMQKKVDKLAKQSEQNARGKVREGRKIGKLRYQFKQYIPQKEELNKKISKVGLSGELMRDRYDSIFRRGIMEPRSVKVHANKTKNIKVIQRERE